MDLTTESFTGSPFPTANSTSTDPLTPCPREVYELILGLVFGLAIVLSNVASIKVTLAHKSSNHPENKYFVVNLAVSNLLCGFALLVTNTLDVLGAYQVSGLTLAVCLRICTYWAPIYILCVMAPYVALATLGLDIAFYCHRPMDYHRRMSRLKLWISIGASWLYPLLVVTLVIGINQRILCDVKHWEMSIYIILFPLLLMLLPAVLVIAIFVHIFRRYLSTSRHLAQRMSTPQVFGSFSDTKRRMVRRFITKFSHLIVFSIFCGLLYTFLTVTEVLLEVKGKQRICIFYRLDRLFISLNSLLAPWIHSLATHQNRKKFRRKMLAWWQNNCSGGNKGGIFAPRSFRRTSSRTTAFVTTQTSVKDPASPRQLLSIDEQKVASPGPAFLMSSVKEASYNASVEDAPS